MVVVPNEAVRVTHTRMGTVMTTTTDPALARLRLLHLVSPTLPVGAFTYSQGVEWAVECGWVHDEATLKAWLDDLLQGGMTWLELPLLARLYRAAEQVDIEALAVWSHTLLAARETRELRDEEHNRGRALTSLLPELGIPLSAEQRPHFRRCQLAGFAHAAHCWRIPLADAAAGYVWGWLENIVLAGVKIIPLGQSAGQRIIAELTPSIPELVARGLGVADDDIGASATAQAIASSRHETQYTRIYRS